MGKTDFVVDWARYKKLANAFYSDIEGLSTKDFRKLQQSSLNYYFRAVPVLPKLRGIRKKLFEKHIPYFKYCRYIILVDFYKNRDRINESQRDAWEKAIEDELLNPESDLIKSINSTAYER